MRTRQVVLSVLAVVVLAAALTLVACSASSEQSADGGSAAQDGDQAMIEAYAGFLAAEEAEDFEAMRTFAAEGAGMDYVRDRENEAEFRAEGGQGPVVSTTERAWLDDVLVVALSGPGGGAPVYYAIAVSPDGTAVLKANLGSKQDALRYEMVEEDGAWKVGEFQDTEPFDRSAYTDYEAAFE